MFASISPRTNDLSFGQTKKTNNKNSFTPPAQFPTTCQVKLVNRPLGRTDTALLAQAARSRERGVEQGPPGDIKTQPTANKSEVLKYHHFVGAQGPDIRAMDRNGDRVGSF